MIAISPTYIAEALTHGRTADELARELEISTRHVRRLAKAGGWVPPPRVHTGRRTLRVSVSHETYEALRCRGGRSVEETAAALLVEVASASELHRQREAAASPDVSPSWSAGYLDALVGRIERVR